MTSDLEVLAAKQSGSGSEVCYTPALWLWPCERAGTSYTNTEVPKKYITFSPPQIKNAELSSKDGKGSCPDQRTGSTSTWN